MFKPSEILLLQSFDFYL